MTSDPLAQHSTVLDLDQLKRIEATHRGFLYQHLYVVASLLCAQAAGVRVVIVEQDEDVELRTDDAHLYIQVKTRLNGLQPKDIKGALERFAVLRAEHALASTALTPGADGARLSATAPRRVGSARFVIITNAAPSPELERNIVAPSWPGDVLVVWPDCGVTLPIGVSPAWPSVRDAFLWCVEQAKKVPFSRVAPDTLVWKLAALTQAAAMGGADGLTEPHQFPVDTLPELFEQVVRSLQKLPEAPEPYWPHEKEPAFNDTAPVRLVVGPSGAGKTAWAAVYAKHAPETVAYFAVSATGGAVFASALVQELAARFVQNDAEGLASVLKPGALGFDALRALALLLKKRNLRPAIVVDDVQKLIADDIVQVVRCAPDLRWIFLAHPGPTVSQFEARLGIRAEMLAGWTLDTVAAVLSMAGCAVDAPACQCVRDLTAGLPLFVRNLAHLATEQYGGNVVQLCDILEHGAHLQPTAQEALLENTVGILSPTARQVADLLGIARVPLNVDEVTQVAESVDIALPAVGRALRDLAAWGVVRHPQPGMVQLHDAFRLLCDGSSGALSTTALKVVYHSLISVMDPAHGFSIERVSRYLELLVITGETEQLIEIVTSESEQMHELGLAGHVTQVLEATVANDMADAATRFWCLDTLAFWDLQAGRMGGAKPRIDQMIRLLANNDIGQRATEALLVKRILLAGTERDIDAARRLMGELLVMSSDDVLRRIVRYNFAVALYKAGQFYEAAKNASALGLEYYDVLNLDPIDVFRRNAPEVVALLPKTPNVLADVKRLADALDLYARAQAAVNESYGLALIHAFKFYTICGAYQSAVKTGQDFVDDLLRLGDLERARDMFEQTLLPSIEDLKLVAHLVPVRAHYAVVLAYCGELAKAREEINRLLNFAAMSQEHGHELQMQAQLIEDIAAGRVKLARSTPNSLMPPGAQQAGARESRSGSNDPCPCGSGRKYKKCHGA